VVNDMQGLNKRKLDSAFSTTAPYAMSKLLAPNYYNVISRAHSKDETT
jgi:hypothetical protein